MKRMILAVLNGGGLAKAVEANKGGRFVPDVLKAFAREMAGIRKDAAILFPDVYREVAPTRDTQYRKATSTVFFAMTQLESIVVEAAREAMWRFGWKGDATTGDGVLVRPVGGQAWSNMPADVCRQVELHVHAATGVRIALCLKRVDGSRISPREWPILDIVPSSIQVVEVPMVVTDESPSGAPERS